MLIGRISPFGLIRPKRVEMHCTGKLTHAARRSQPYRTFVTPGVGMA